MIYDEIAGYWIGVDGKRFVRNEFDPTRPTLIVVTEHAWSGHHINKTFTLTWPDTIDPTLKQAIENVMKYQMRRRSPSSLSKMRNVVAQIVAAQPPGLPFDADDLLDPDVIRHVWDSTRPSVRPWLRTLIVDLAETVDPGAAGDIALMMSAWKANRSLRWKRAVLEWDPEQGSLTSAELELLRRYLKPPRIERTSAHFARLFTWLTLTTLRRPSQLIKMDAKALRRITTHIGTTADLRIPGVKGQTGQDGRWLPIPTALADDIDDYRRRVRDALEWADASNMDVLDACLLPLISHERMPEQRIFAPYGAQAKGAVQNWIKSLRLVSPRTEHPLKINLRRIRHTGATHLAMQGYPLDLISDVLEHSNPASTRFYVDAVGAEYLPAFEAADRNLGGRFSMLRAAWFNGRVVDPSDAPYRPIVVPDGQVPAVVGACGKEGTCPVHPLFSCYSCEHFLAFRSADHQKVLDFVEAEYERWRAVETSNSRSKAIKDFDRIAAGVRDVMDLIARGEADDGR
ncbi:Phage integrase family protein [Roseivivax lentus]|uniref:Phage integrase family protein n=1 Tax=Roseivivax lentus TaxID=633194 RepID=A0A1N7KF73_9RHOB|nr:site-specific integrase [Roseivivax lentus]SIS60241.1 Phage integrase family protein [Roseivivax lentus]